MGKKYKKQSDLEHKFNSDINYNDKIEINQEIPENEYSMEENIKNDNFSEIEYIENETIEKENEIIVEKPKKSIADLSKSEYRQYLRTGIIPE
ncbi:MAG TPA: hypothetical protein PLN85_01290 [archaeon]|jgi:hypothetical protein|nr:hypothetical protein [archaeon]